MILTKSEEFPYKRQVSAIYSATPSQIKEMARNLEILLWKSDFAVVHAGLDGEAHEGIGTIQPERLRCAGAMGFNCFHR